MDQKRGEKVNIRPLKPKLDRPNEIWCVICQDWIARSELKRWSGDDQQHFLCPGCDSDLLPTQPSLDAELDREQEEAQDV
jgi:hypothetical protein